MEESKHKTTIIGICLLLITAAFIFGKLEKDDFIIVFGLFTSAGFVLSKDANFFPGKAPKEKKPQPPRATYKKPSPKP